MRRYFFKNPAFFSWVFPKAIWKYSSHEKAIYLTFDDGPSVEATEFVLDLLRKYQAEATFFCIGERLKEFPELVARLIDDDHTIGNHTFDHSDGWRTDHHSYMGSVVKNQEILKNLKVESRLFRPPYGNLTFKSYRSLIQSNYQIVFWSHLSGDFDDQVSLDKALKSLKTAEPGSVLLFHDSAKAFQNLQYLLPLVLEHFTSLGFSFKKIPSTQCL